MAKRNKDLNIPDGIFEAINRHEYDNLKTFLDNTDWYSFTPQFIIPREDIRRLVRIIKDEEVRRDVMNYLKRYASDYFRDGAREMAIDGGGVYIESELERRTDEIMDDFKKELAFQIDLIESNGQFSGDKFSNLNKKIQDLENEIGNLKEERLKLHKEIATQKAMIDELEHPERKHQVPNELQCEEFYHIITYLTKARAVRPIHSPNYYNRDSVCYLWDIATPKSLFGYFVCKTCYLLELRTKDDHLMWKLFKKAFINFDTFEKQARDHASLNKNWEDVRTSVKPDGAHIIDEAFEYCKKQMEISKNRKRE